MLYAEAQLGASALHLLSRGACSVFYTCFAVQVVDTTKPQVVLSGAPTVYEATGPDGYWLDPTTLVKATDAPADNLLLSGVSCTKPAGQFAVGVTSVTCTAEDTSGNKGSLTVDVTVQDTTAPTITVTAPGSREATKPSGADVTWDDPTVSDIVTPADQLDVVCAPPSGSVFAVGEIPVTCTVTDKAGNNATTSFKVTVVDTTPPQLTGVSLNIKVYTGASSEKVTWELPTATDAVTVKPPVQCKPPSGSAFQVDKTTVVSTLQPFQSWVHEAGWFELHKRLLDACSSASANGYTAAAHPVYPVNRQCYLQHCGYHDSLCKC